MATSMCPFSKLGKPSCISQLLRKKKSITTNRRRPSALRSYRCKGLAAQTKVRVECMRALPEEEDSLRRRDAVRNV